MLYRYELYCDDEYQDVGFMQDMCDIFSKDKAKELCYFFDKYLQVPKYCKFTERHTCAFFTELGIRKFQKQIQAIIKAYEEETIFEVKCIEINEEEIEDAILYKDKFQIIVKGSVVHKETTFIP